MCKRENCKYIELITIQNGVKVVLHYDSKDRPVFIEYWNDNTHFNRGYRPLEKCYECKIKELEMEQVESKIKTNIIY
jgi:hypothetical protein